jgi:PmbA protein
MTDLTILFTNVQESATELGISKFDIYGATVDSNSVQVYQGEAKQIKASSRSSIIVRVWNDQQTMGVTTTTDLNPLGLKMALKTAKEASNFGVKENVPDFSPEAAISMPAPEDQKVPQAPVSELITSLLQAEKDLLESHPAITDVPYNGLSQNDSDRFYLNSEGALRQEARSYASVYLYSKTEEPGKKPRAAGAYKISRSLPELDLKGCVTEAAEKTISHLDYEKIISGKYPVVFSAEAFLGLLGAFSNLFNAQNILDKLSLSTPDSLGEVLASPLLCVADDPLNPENLGGETFDGEGTPTRKVELIKDGVLTSFLHSAGTAKRMKAQPTGNASIGAKVSISPHFYHVYPGAKAEQDLSLDTAENVILIDELHALHAGVKSLQGSFSLPFDGWIVNQGKKTSIESATVAGDFREVLKSIVYVESEPEITPGGLSPRVWVGELSITGE